MSTKVHRLLLSTVMKITHTHTQPFNGLLSGTIRVSRYQKKHSPTHTHPDHRTSFITFLHLQRSMASSLFIFHEDQKENNGNTHTRRFTKCLTPNNKQSNSYFHRIAIIIMVICFIFIISRFLFHILQVIWHNFNNFFNILRCVIIIRCAHM